MYIQGMRVGRQVGRGDHAITLSRNPENVFNRIAGWDFLIFS